MSTRKVKLADVLWEAANEFLSATQTTFLEPFDSPTRYLTCNAVAKAIRSDAYWKNLPYDAATFLKSLGCPMSSPDGFNDFAMGSDRQGVRYMWLLLAMHVAADEGIEIEVSA